MLLSRIEIFKVICFQIPMGLPNRKHNVQKAHSLEYSFLCRKGAEHLSGSLSCRVTKHNFLTEHFTNMSLKRICAADI